jgi:RimJ/RimL family protein N-acetyltransferase
MDEEPEVISLADGGTLTIRQTAPDDVDALLRMYESLSADDRYRRFFSVSRPQHRTIERLVHTSSDNGLWLVAVTDDGAVVADVGYTGLPDGDAELAITVTEPWRGWLGPFLLDLLCQRAAAHGIANLRANVLLDNRRMLRLLARRGCATVSFPDAAIVELTVSSREPMPGWPPVGDRPRLLLEGCGGRWARAAEARRAGWSVVACAGPGSNQVPSCPLLEGGHCPLVDGADEIVLAFPATDPRRAQLARAHAARTPDKPVGAEEWVPTEGARPAPMNRS